MSVLLLSIVAVLLALSPARADIPDERPGMPAARVGIVPQDDRAGVAEAAPRPRELRMFALYGPGEFSTFSAVPAGPWAAGETARSGKPLDRHTEDALLLVDRTALVVDRDRWLDADLHPWRVSDDDPWLAFDKAQHVAFSFLWTLGTQYVAVNKGSLSEAQALPISISASAVVGLTKEYYDLRAGPPNVFSYKDLVADGVGILLAVGIILL